MKKLILLALNLFSLTNITKALEQNPDKDQSKDFVKEFQHPNNSGIDFESVQQDYQNLKAQNKA